MIQETLREFFSAIQNGRDAEPSWKKTIYKIINRMDDPIPEYFKDPNFLERLEGWTYKNVHLMPTVVGHSGQF